MVERIREIKITVRVDTNQNTYEKVFDRISEAEEYLDVMLEDDSAEGLRNLHGGVAPAKPRFEVSELHFHPGVFQVYDNSHSHMLMRGTEAECLSYADSLNNHNLKKEG